MSLVLIFFISTRPTFDTKASNVLTNHILWVAFIFMMSIVLIPRVVSKETNQYVNEAIMLTACIFIIMSIAVYLFPVFFSETFSFMYPALLVALIAIIIFEVVNIFTYSSAETFTQMRRMVSYVVIFVFSLYISYDTSKMIQLSKLCVRYPNYPKTSVMFFLDVINIFSRILFLKSGR
jgi:FtsH-binding integral membrane protein